MGTTQATTLRVNVVDSSTPLLAVRRLAEALGGVGAWESISLAAFGRRTKHIAATTAGAGVEAMASIASDLARAVAA